MGGAQLFWVASYQTLLVVQQSSINMDTLIELLYNSSAAARTNIGNSIQSLTTKATIGVLTNFDDVNFSKKSVILELQILRQSRPPHTIPKF